MSSLQTSNDLHKLRASHGQKGHLGLSGYSLSQQSLPTAWRPKQQRTLGNLGSQLEVSLWILKTDNISVVRNNGELKVLLTRCEMVDGGNDYRTNTYCYESGFLP